MTNPTKYAGNGQYVLTKMSLFSIEDEVENETEWDLMPSFLELSLFESVFDQTMSGYVTVRDTVGMADLFPLYGDERIEVSFHTAGSEDSLIEYVGKVYKVSQPARVNEHTTGYIIRFCSEANLLSTRRFVQKGYQDTADRVVEDIYRKHLRGSDDKPLETLPAKGIESYTFGFMNPLEAISVAAKTPVASDGTRGYIFFENHESFMFTTLEHLYTQEPVARYTNQLAGVYDDVKQRAREQFESIQDITYDRENSYLDRLKDGLHGSDNVYFDLVTKQVVNYHYNKEQYFDETRSLGKRPYKHKIEDSSDIVNVNYVAGTGQYALNEVLNKMRRVESEEFMATITVFGDSKLKTGDVLEVYFPRMNDDQEERQSTVEGKVLIGAIRHTITQSQYMQAIELLRDAYNEDVEV